MTSDWVIASRHFVPGNSNDCEEEEEETEEEEIEEEEDLSTISPVQKSRKP